MDNGRYIVVQGERNLGEFHFLHVGPGLAPLANVGIELVGVGTSRKGTRMDIDQYPTEDLAGIHYVHTYYRILILLTGAYQNIHLTIAALACLTVVTASFSSKWLHLSLKNQLIFMYFPAGLQVMDANFRQTRLWP